MSLSFSIKKCLKAISKDNPVGEDLRNDQSIDALYYQMKDLRNAARDSERKQAMGQESDASADWGSLAKLCITALTEKSKDLEIASWLIESMIRLDGFAGLTKSVQLMTALANEYWDAVYPMPDDEGMETRLAPIVSLNGDDFDGTLIAPIAHVAITAGTSCGPYALWQYQQAIENAKLTDKNIIEKRQEQGGVFMAQIQMAVSESSKDFYQQLQQNIADAKLAYLSLDECLAEKCGNNVPPKAKILQALDDFSDYLRFITKDTPFAKLQVVTEVIEPHSDVINQEVMPNSVMTITPDTASSSLKTRDDALSQLGQLANFFRQTEPQSPLPFLLERAQQLGRLSFPELLRELVNDDGARSAAYKLMGVEMVEADS